MMFSAGQRFPLHSGTFLIVVESTQVTHLPPVAVWHLRNKSAFTVSGVPPRVGTVGTRYVTKNEVSA